MASPTTIGTKLFESALEQADIKVILPTDSEQKLLEHSIRKVISSKSIPEDMHTIKLISVNMLDAGAEKIILGCTELSVIADNNGSSIFVDPLELIVKNILRSPL